ncbi:MAG TPA: PAS domain S-box protein, partial [Thermodesulfobacteriota bacterium]|nr:PAS domain S-box protein [Thermodesulfobacteriota bacterium]
MKEKLSQAEQKKHSLRNRAEELVTEKPKNLGGSSATDVQTLIHELQVHQIELEMQNEELRKTQIELEESHKKYADLYDFAPVGYFMLDGNGLIQGVNLTGATLLGVGKKYLIERPFSLYISRADHAVFYSYRRQLLETASTQNCELKMLRKDGTTFYARLEGISIFNSEGNFSYLKIVIFDVTQQRKKAEELFESEERFRIMADNAPVMIWTSGVDKLCNYFNKGWLQFTGRTMEEELGNGWAEGVHPNDLKGCLETYCKAFDARNEFRTEYRLRRFDGNYRWILDHGTPRYLPDGSFAGYIGSCVDITERKQAEESLRNSEERYRALYENNPLMCFTIDTEGKILSVNQFGAEQLGHTAEELVGQSVLKVFYEEDKKAVLEQLTICLQNPTQIARWEFRKIRKDGKILWVREAARTIRDINDNTAVLIVCEDITDRKLVMELQQERLRFETLLSEISSRFLYLAPNETDSGIEQCLKDLVEFLGYDRSSIALFSEGMTKLCITHTYARPGFEPAPKGDFSTIFPWYTDMLRKGETLVFSNLP